APPGGRPRHERLHAGGDRHADRGRQVPDARELERGGRIAPRFHLCRGEGGAVSDDAAAAEPAWLAIGRELKAIAQIGLTFNRDPYDRARYERIRELAAAVIAAGSGHHPGSFLGPPRGEA